MSEVETTVEVQQPGDALFNKSFDIIKESMKDVKQEILIKLKDGTDHIVYLHDCIIDNNGKMVVDFSTLSEDRKVEIGEAVEACMQAQFTESLSRKSKRKKILAF
ncbi:hypothetical protein ACX818_001377 [Acinetobacter baumannii]